MKRKGCSIIFVNDRKSILLVLRDDIPDLPYANMWDLPGGHVEEHETPYECIVREMKEEMNLDLHGIDFFRSYEFDDRTDFVFWKNDNMDVKKINITEGQCLKWFTKSEVEDIELAYGFNLVVSDFYKNFSH